MKYGLNASNAVKHIYSGHLDNMSGNNKNGDTISFTNYYMEKNHKPFYVISGEFHYSRYDCNFWEEEILKMKACGLDTIATYMFWIHHEPVEGEFNFTGNFDLRRFIMLCGKHNIDVILRIGPYAHGECRNGGLPDWLFGRPFEVRSNDEGYIKYVTRYFARIAEQVRDLTYENNGPIIATQLENEYQAACSPWEVTVTQNREWITHGTGGLEHIIKLRDIIQGFGLKTPFMTCTGWGGAPYIDGEILPLWGGYAYWPWLYWNKETFEHPPTYSYLFKNGHDENLKDDLDKKYPYACGEMGGGMQTWYVYRFEVEPESVEAMSLVTIANGCNILGYFMFHGGCNPVINNTFMNEQYNPRISYDFQAPLGEFGQPKESYKRIKNIHYMLRDFNDFYCTTPCIVPECNQQLEPTDVTTLRYAARSNGKQAFLFINNYQDHVEQAAKNDVQIEIKLDNKTVTIPQNHTMNIAKNEVMALPVNFNFGGVDMEYATASYLTRIDNTIFFFSHDQLQPEFCFNTPLLPTKTNGVKAITDDRKLFITASESGISSFTINTPNDGEITFVCIDRKLSLDFWRVEVNGKAYAIISSANVTFTNESISFENVGGNEFSILAYPSLGDNISPDFVKAEDVSVFTSYQCTEVIPVPEITYETPYPNRALLHFDANVMENLSELYLYTDYYGDVAWAFINGTLIHDDISNGSTWKIGLKRFENELKHNEMYLYLSPISNEGSVAAEATSTFAKIHLDENCKAKFESIRLVPEKTYTIKLKRI